ncbi:MAG: hypothetical protein WBE83_07265 [Candidatus Cybelea sp.]|jgi:hypothetical protein
MTAGRLQAQRERTKPCYAESQHLCESTTAAGAPSATAGPIGISLVVLVAIGVLVALRDRAAGSP